MSVPSPSIVVDVLRRENEELATTVSQLTKEKLELRSQLAKLSRSSQEPPYKENKEQVSCGYGILEIAILVTNGNERVIKR